MAEMLIVGQAYRHIQTTLFNYINIHNKILGTHIRNIDHSVGWAGYPTVPDYPAGYISSIQKPDIQQYPERVAGYPTSSNKNDIRPNPNSYTVLKVGAHIQRINIIDSVHDSQ